MSVLHQIEQQIIRITGSLERPCPTYGDIDLCAVLYDLGSKAEWNKSELESADFLSTRLEISKKYFLGYYLNGRKAINTVLTDPLWLELATAIALKSLFLTQNDLQENMLLKRFNVVFKSLDTVHPDWLSEESLLGKALALAWSSLLGALSVPTDGEVGTIKNYFADNFDGKELEIIPLTVLFYEGPIARAYLETIKSLGYQPQKIIELVSSKDVVSKKTVGKWLPQGLRKFYAASIQRSKIHYWPQQLKKTSLDLVNCISDEVETAFCFSRDTIDGAHKLHPLSAYSHCIESLLVEGLSDSVLHKHLLQEAASAILFTGGGLVPASLLDIEHLKFLHIHPGFLPNIRGADCVLWSSILAGKASATCFYMSPGIDAGDVIISEWLPKVVIKYDPGGIDKKLLYRSIYGFYDPWVRSFVLRKILSEFDCFEIMPSNLQDENEGVTYYFMHEAIQTAVFSRIFKK